MSEMQSDVLSTKLEEEISTLKEQLMLIMSKLEDQRSVEKELLKSLEQWKDEENERQKAKMQEIKQMLLKEFNKLTDMTDLLNDFLYHLHSLHSSAYIKDENKRKLADKLDRKLQKQKEWILSQREQIETLTSNPPEHREKKVEVKKQKCAVRRNLMKELSLSLQALVEELEDICMELFSAQEKKVGVTKQSLKSHLRRNRIIKELWKLLAQDFSEDLEDFWTELFYVLQKKVEIKKQMPKTLGWKSTVIKELGPLLLQALVEELEDLIVKVFYITENKVEEKKQKAERSFSRTPTLKELGSVLLRTLLEELEDFCMKVFCATEKNAEEKKQTPKSPLRRSPVVQELQPFSLEERSKEELVERSRAAEISMTEFVALAADSDTEWTDMSDMENNQQQEQLNRHSTQKKEKASQGGLIKNLQHLERLFTERALKKPMERDLSHKRNVWQKPEDSEKDDSDDNDDNDENDYDYSDSCSLEDNPSLSKPAAVKNSLDSMSTSVWASSTGKMQTLWP